MARGSGLAVPRSPIPRTHYNRSTPMPVEKTKGRFAPSPTGPLHLGSLVAAVGSWLFARVESGTWIVRMEDLDAPRVVAGSADEIVHALRRYGLESDEPIVHQSQRASLYEHALEEMRNAGLAYDCGCSRADLQRAASAPASSDPIDADSRIYPGTCRDGLPPGRAARAVRFRVPHDTTVTFDDLILGRIEERVDMQTGDFVIKRADGLFAYQLAVVVDDAQQEVTQVVRGADLLTSTARQILLQRALGYSQPRYAHLPLVVTSTGTKVGKREGALPLPLLDDEHIRSTLQQALSILGVPVEEGSPATMLQKALERFDPAVVPRQRWVASQAFASQ